MSRLRLFLGIVALMAVMAPGTSVSARTTYPTVAVTLGTTGYFPNHPNGWWRDESSRPWWSDDFTSYCANPPTDGFYQYGVLTHPQGYEITQHGYGDHAYLMYDPYTGWIRAANVRGSDGTLVAPGRIDTCRAPGAPEEEPPPPPPPPPHGLAGGNDTIVGTYSCNVVRPEAGSSQVHLGEDGTFTVTPDRATTSSAEPRQGTWWSYPGDPQGRGGGVSLRDGVFVHFQGDTSRFTIEEDRLVISGFACTRLDPTR